jgi:hypothetical protein
MDNKINDGKNNFYRQLNLNKEDRKLIRWYRETVKQMKNEPEDKKGKKNA